MITISLDKLHQVIDVEKYVSDNDQKDSCVKEIESVLIDSRVQSKNSLFVAIKGEQFDGHDYCEQAIRNGAIALVLTKELPELLIPQFIVNDTRKALGQIGAWVKEQVNPMTIALTGSCGKTTVKEMTSSILSQLGATFATPGNYNNDIGVPLTLLKLTPEDKYAVIEQGANHIGEIAYSSQFIHAQIVLINNIASAHLEGFGSLEGVAIAKGEIFHNFDARALEENLDTKQLKIAVINLDSQQLPLWRTRYKTQLDQAHLLTFSQDDSYADFYGSEIMLDQSKQANFVLNTPQGKIDITLPVLGLHNVSNAVAASALAMCAGASLEQIKIGLEQIKPIKGRTQAVQLNQRVTVIDDTYNASVSSMFAAIDLLVSYSGLKLLLLADMAELGAQTEVLHRQVAEHIALLSESSREGLTVYSYGKQSRCFSQAISLEEEKIIPLDSLNNTHPSDETEGYPDNDLEMIDLDQTAPPSLHFSEIDALTNAVKHYLYENRHQQITILVKGANSMNMGVCIDKIKEVLEQQALGERR